MTNEMIILTKSVELMNAGVIKGTGKYAEAEINGKIEKFEIPEEIHTYDRWKKLGFQVQRGQTSFIKFKVWFFTGRNQMVDDNDENTNQRGKCYMKTASFFTAEQVKAIEA